MNARIRLVACTVLLCLSNPGITRAQNAGIAAAPSPAETSTRAWALLEDTLSPGKHTDDRVQALAALGILGNDPRASTLIREALGDKELDVRTAAIFAAAETKNIHFLEPLRNALDDPEPQVAYAAAVTLWKMNDHSGEDLLTSVVMGDRSANPTMMKGARHKAYRTMRNPAELAKLGALQGAGMLLGPFGFGLTAVEYARKNGGDSARVNAIELLATQHNESVHQALLAALDDKDTAVRVAIARALCQWPGPSTATALTPWIDDPKLPVRLTAAAAYLRAAQTSPQPRHRASRKT